MKIAKENLILRLINSEASLFDGIENSAKTLFVVVSPQTKIKEEKNIERERERGTIFSVHFSKKNFIFSSSLQFAWCVCTFITHITVVDVDLVNILWTICAIMQCVINFMLAGNKKFMSFEKKIKKGFVQKVKKKNKTKIHSRNLKLFGVKTQ